VQKRGQKVLDVVAAAVSTSCESFAFEDATDVVLVAAAAAAAVDLPFQ
jgi:hypothetical protein